MANSRLTMVDGSGAPQQGLTRFPTSACLIHLNNPNGSTPVSFIREQIPELIDASPKIFSDPTAQNDLFSTYPSPMIDLKEGARANSDKLETF